MDRVFSPECCVSIFVLLIGISIPLTYIAETWYHDGRQATVRHTKLTIGIMSARENFENRQTLRSSWIQDIGNNLNQISGNIEYKFIVGSQSCDVNIRNRKDQYVCERLNFSQPDMLEGDEFPFLLSDINKPDDLNPKQLILFNLSMIVRYPVVVKKLGLHLSIKLMQSPITVQIYDINREQSVVTAKFNSIDKGITFHYSNLDISNYRFQPINHILLPKDFEGSLLVFSEDEIMIDHSTVDFPIVDNSGGTLEFMPIDIHGYPIEANLTSTLFMPNIIGKIHDKDHFDLLIESADQLDSEHRHSEALIDEKLFEEINLHDDILLVDVVDVYRNLPKKLLQFHKWIYSDKHVQYVLKTDDDCYLHILQIIESLQTITSIDSKVWWGNFRENWYVERTGKWAEKNFRSSEYPAFACGSGNIVSHMVSDWLAFNADELFPYQGEDTSMGIWLSALGPHYLNDNRWLCEKGCNENALAIPQLTIEEIQEYWTNKQTCGNICSCP